jgi:hypothetical protein
MSELLKLLDKLGVKLTSKDMATIPARGTDVHAWRITLARTMGRGQEKKEVKFTSTYLTGKTEPTITEVLQCVIEDAKASELTLWDFGQAYCGGRTDSETERLHKACKKVGQRAKRFFGEFTGSPQWLNVVNASLGIAPTDLPVAKAKRNKQKHD